jgi:hypothetical protein
MDLTALSQANGNSCRQVIFATLLGLCLTAWSSADEVPVVSNGEARILLTEPADPTRVTRVKYSLQLKGTLSTPSASGNTDWDLNSSAIFEFDQRRFPSENVGPLAIRATRNFQEARTSSVVGKDHKNSAILPVQSRLIHVYGGEMQLVQLSPDVRLTRPQLDLLQFPCDPLAVTGLLPGRSLNSKTEKWNADGWVVPLLAGIDAAVTQSATCEIKSLTEREAVILFQCNGTGAITGSPTEVSLRGEMIVDRKAAFITQLKATMTEKRGPGTVSPGLNVTADIHWTQLISGEQTSLPETMPETRPEARQLLLTLVTPWRILLLHDRNWHIFHETSELVMLRMLHNGALLAQCNIASAPLVAAGKFTSESDYLADVDKALRNRAGKITASNVLPDQNGWRIHHVSAAGEANKKKLVWDYFLCTTSSGEQISLVFSHADEDSAVFGDGALQMVRSLTIRSSRPRIPLPR